MAIFEKISVYLIKLLQSRAATGPKPVKAVTKHCIRLKNSNNACLL